MPLSWLEQADRGVEAHRLVVRPLGHQRVEVIDHRQNARAERNLLAFQARRITLAVPSLVVAEDQRRHRIGKRHAADDFGADLRVDADLLEFFLRQRPGLRQDVLGNRQLADVVQQRRGLDALDLGLGHAERAREPGGVDLDAADVALRGLILGVDRQRQRLDGRQVQVRHLPHVPLLVLDAAHVDLVGAIDQIQRRRGQQRHPVAAALDDCRGDRGRAGADEVARRAPQEVLVPDAADRLLGREADRGRDQRGVEDEVGGRRADERLGDREDCERHERWRRRRAACRPAGRLHGQHQRRHAEERPVRRRCASAS